MLKNDWEGCIARAESCGKLLVLPRATEAIKSVIEGGLKPSTRVAPLLQTDVFEVSCSIRTLGNGALPKIKAIGDEAIERITRLHAETLQQLQDRHSGYYFPLTEEVLADILNEGGALAMSHKDGEDLAQMYLNKSHRVVLPLCKVLAANSAVRVDVSKVAEIGGFLPLPKTRIPKNMDRAQLLSQPMLALQRAALRKQVDLALAVVHKKNKVMQGILKGVSSLK